MIVHNEFSKVYFPLKLFRACFSSRNFSRFSKRRTGLKLASGLSFESNDFKFERLEYKEGLFKRLVFRETRFKMLFEMLFKKRFKHQSAERVL